MNKQLMKHLDPMWTEDMLIYGFRYCLGRLSYSVAVCIDYLTPLVPYIHVESLKLISREISEYRHFKEDDFTTKDWFKFKEFVDKEIERRNAS